MMEKRHTCFRNATKLHFLQGLTNKMVCNETDISLRTIPFFIREMLDARRRYQEVLKLKYGESSTLRTLILATLCCRLTIIFSPLAWYSS
jgi:hypothetical protein